MPVGAKRGLVAPQNTFLENVIRKINSFEANSSFLIANAQLCDWPIVYANEGFCDMTGYTRPEIMNRSCVCDFMHRERTKEETVEKLKDTLESKSTGKFELQMYCNSKSSDGPTWFLIHVAPIMNEENKAVLFLLIFKDISYIKEPVRTDKARFNSLMNKMKKNHEADKVPEVINERGHTPARNQRYSELQKVLNLDPVILPRYHHEAPKTPKMIILHYSTFKLIWDWFILLLTFYTAVIVPYNVSFGLKANNSHVWLVSDTIVDLIFVLDIVINLRTTFVGPGGEVISEPVVIQMNYMRSWFVVDLLSCLPYDLLNYLTSPEGSYAEEGISSLFSSFKVTRLLRLGRVARKLDHYIEYGGAMLVLLVVLFGLSGHWLACLWYVIGQQELDSYVGTLPKRGWLISFANSVNKEYYLDANGTICGGPSNQENYIASFYFTMTSLTSVGFGNIAATTEAEQCFTVAMLIFGALLYATIFGNVTTIIQQMYSDTNRYHDMLNSVREFLKLYDIPVGLKDRIMDYIVSTWSMSKGIDTEKVLNYCPKDMKADICVHLNRKVFNNHASFRLASDSCLRAIAIEFITTHTAPGDMIYHKGENVDALCFVVSGSLEIIQDGEVVAILSKGDSFGDTFWHDTSASHSESHVRALTYCDLHSVKREPLLRILNFYPMFANDFMKKMVLTFNIRKRVLSRRISDVREEQRLNDPSYRENWSDDHPVRAAAEKFKSRVYHSEFSDEDRTCSKSHSSKSGKSMEEASSTQKRFPRKRHSHLAPEENKDSPVQRTAHATPLKIPDHAGDTPTPAYMILKSESMAEGVEDMRRFTQEGLQSINDRITRMEDQLSRIIDVMERQSVNPRVGGSNANANNNSCGSSELGERESSVSILMPSSRERDESNSRQTKRFVNEEEAKSCDRYWLTRDRPESAGLVANPFRLTDNSFSRHFHKQ